MCSSDLWNIFLRWSVLFRRRLYRNAPDSGRRNAPVQAPTTERRVWNGFRWSVLLRRRLYRYAPDNGRRNAPSAPALGTKAREQRTTPAKQAMTDELR